MFSFEWDADKNKINIENHSDAEDRFRLLGSSVYGNVLLVVHCIREDDIIRIISSRKATANEKKEYERRIENV